MRSSKASAYDRSVFRTGEYLKHFRPDESTSPFARIYQQKQSDVLTLVEGRDLFILDVGGGMGRMSVPLAQENRVVLCDLSWDMLTTAASRNALGLQYVQANAQDLPFADGLFDYVLAIDLLVHLEYPRGTFTEFARVLRPEGKLIVDSTNGNPLWTFFYPAYVGKNPLRWAKTVRAGGVLPEWQPIVTHYRTSGFLDLLAAAGFKVLRRKNYGPRFCPKWNLALAVNANPHRHDNKYGGGRNVSADGVKELAS
jgi:ubiquinone/menaquinone biosynthesis C-methylase UbiE